MSEPRWPQDYVALCPECGAETTAQDYDADLIDVIVPEPMWPGGPMIAVKGMTEKRTATNQRYTFWPCGHVVPAEGIEIVCRLRSGA